MRCGLKDGERLGLMGFGASAHLVLQLAHYLYPRSAVFVFARDKQDRAFALELGAAWAGGVAERPPEPVDAVIDTTPAWRPVMEALLSLRPGGRLVINAIRKEDQDKPYLMELDYERHLWMEKQIVSVANITHHDLSAFLPLAADAGIRPKATCLPLAEANKALNLVKEGGQPGALVLVPG